MLDFSAPLSTSTPFLMAMLDHRARAIFEEYGLEIDEELRYGVGERPLGLFIDTAPELTDDPQRRASLLARLAELPPQRPIDSRRVETPRAPVRIGEDGLGLRSVPASTRMYDRVEIELDGPRGGRPYLDVKVSAEIVRPDATRIVVDGFFAGAGRYCIRYMPEVVGEYRFRTSSNAPALDGHVGTFHVEPALEGHRGPVRADAFRFRHDDGTVFHPVGTTAYAWLFQSEDRQRRTLAALAGAGFNKLRMCLTPKWFAFNEHEPVSAPFVRGADGAFDFDQPDTAFWDLVDARVSDLGELGIQAEVILFHPYDTWGFSDMGPEADARYVSYAVARLASYANIWWSLANEFDVLLTKDTADWEALGELIARADPTRHERSIHHCLEPYDHARPWITHASLQTAEVERVSAWRAQWGKPVVIDECSYEGDLAFIWGNIDAEEMTRRHWEAATRGGYAAHGETFAHPESEIWWATGGELRGESPDRLRFLRVVLDDAPDGGWEPLGLGDAYPTVGSDGAFILTYFGVSRPTKHLLLLDPADAPWDVDVIDTWRMRIERVATGVSGRILIDLPGERYLAVRARRHA